MTEGTHHPPDQILRIRFSKRGPVRFISHRDVARSWERAFRKARLPLAFTAGFSPHPRVSFGLALPLGWESDAEYIDVHLAERCDPQDVAARLDAALPEGMRVEDLAEIPATAPSAAAIVRWADYAVAVRGPHEGPPPAPAAVAAGLDLLLGDSEWIAPRRRKGREVEGTEDVRPLVAHVSLADTPPDGFGPTALSMRLATQPRVLRPEEVLVLLSDRHPEAACEAARVRRLSQIVVADGGNADPLTGSGAVPPPAPPKEISALDAKVPSPT